MSPWMTKAARAQFRQQVGKNPVSFRKNYRYNRAVNATGEQVQLLQLLISGIAQGCIYGLIALGFVLIYKATETVSFAQGELMMLGAFGGLAGMTLLGFPYWLSVLSTIAAMAIFGVLLERVVIRPILGQPAFPSSC